MKAHRALVKAHRALRSRVIRVKGIKLTVQSGGKIKWLSLMWRDSVYGLRSFCKPDVRLSFRHTDQKPLLGPYLMGDGSQVSAHRHCSGNTRGGAELGK